MVRKFIEGRGIKGIQGRTDKPKRRERLLVGIKKIIGQYKDNDNYGARRMAIARLYGMIQPGASGTETVRNVFYIDPNGIIRAKLIYPLTNGRNIGEILRLLDALQTTDRDKVATPANWRPGFPTIIPSPQTLGEAKQRLDSGDNCMDWYLCYNQPKELT